VSTRRDDDDFEVVDAVPVDPDAPAPYAGARAERPVTAAPADPRHAADPPAPSPARTRPGRSLAAAVAAVPVGAQAAAVAATGLAAGAVTAAVVRRAAHRRAVKTRRGRADRGLPVVASRSFVVDIHLLAPRD